MMQKILVPTDFSATATKALTYAAEIAQRTGSVIYLLHIAEAVTDYIAEPYPWHQGMENEFIQNKMDQLRALEQQLKQVYPDIYIESEVKRGSVINSVLDFAEGKQADLIVMGTTGASGLKEIFMGSVAAGTIGKTKIPVLTVPVCYEVEDLDAILFVTNTFEENKELLKPITDLASIYTATIHVAVFVDEDEALDYLQNAKWIDRYVDFLRNAFPENKFKGEVLEGKDFETTVERYDDKNEIDVIATITYPKNFIKRLLKKSVTKKLASHSTIPMLAIPM